MLNAYWNGLGTIQEITANEIPRRADSTFAADVPMQMYVVLRCKTRLARNFSAQIKDEAWRVARKLLFGIDGPRQEEEVHAIADLLKFGLAALSRLDSQYVRWESELKTRGLVNRSYVISKRGTCKSSPNPLPNGFQQIIEAEVAKGQLQRAAPQTF